MFVMYHVCYYMLHVVVVVVVVCFLQTILITFINSEPCAITVGTIYLHIDAYDDFLYWSTSNF